uniref:Uncharacterized protein n=1 Tax=Arundo donax TaxID=35708 RepID=A0A0A9D3Z4_ARUDO
MTPAAPRRSFFSSYKLGTPATKLRFCPYPCSLPCSSLPNRRHRAQNRHRGRVFSNQSVVPGAPRRRPEHVHGVAFTRRPPEHHRHVLPSPATTEARRATSSQRRQRSRRRLWLL